MGQRQLAIQHATRADELRQRAADRERFFIEYAYERDVTGDLEKAFQSVTVWIQTYPRDVDAHGLRGGFSAHGTGRYEEVLQAAQRALAIDPEMVFAHSESVSANLFLLVRATGDPSFAVESDYYAKAVAWDAHQAQAARGDAIVC